MITLFILSAALFSAPRHKTKHWHLSSVTGTAAAVVKCRGNGSFCWKTGSFSCGAAFSGAHGGPGLGPLPCHSRAHPVPQCSPDQMGKSWMFCEGGGGRMGEGRKGFPGINRVYLLAPLSRPQAHLLYTPP